MTALRVLFLIPGTGQGSSMIFARRQAASLQAAGIEVRTFFLRSRTSPLELVREFRRFRRDLRRYRPALVHAHFGTVTATFAALGGGALPLVVTYRGSDLNPSPRWFALRSLSGRVLSQLAALRATRIICVSNHLRDRLWWRREAVTVLASGVDPALFRPEPRDAARRRLGWLKSERVVLFNAGHDPVLKRMDLARSAVAAAQRSIPRLRWEIMDGTIPPPMVPTLMNAADCLLLTSDSEGSPTVIQEALACNLPIVSVNAGDAVEKLRGVRQTRIVPRDPKLLGAALVEILRSAGRSDGRRKVTEFSAPTIAARLEQVYHEIIGAGVCNISLC